MSSTIRPRRSCLYMPGANSRALEKAKSLSADMLILDLEDAVAPESKELARDLVADAVNQRAFGYREVVIRVNSFDTEWGKDDMQAAVGARPDGILVPKVVSANDIAMIDAELTRLNASNDLGLWVMIEMPLAILNIAEIAKASENTRLTGFVMGTNDLAKELDCVPTSDRLAFLSSLSLSVVAARAYGLTVIDGVFNDIADEDGFESECNQGRKLGFDGKTLIHPKQLEVANRVFSPSADAVAQAYDVIKAFADPANKGSGVIKVNGKMTELLHLEQAKSLVAKAEAIASVEKAAP